MELPIDSIVVGDRSRSGSDLRELIASIRQVGIIHPPTVRLVDGAYVLVAGGRRLAAMRLLGWTTVPVTVSTTLDDELSALLAEGEENSCREPFKPSDAVRHAARIEAVLAAQAKQRMADAGRSAAPGRPAERSSESDEVSPAERRTDAKVAKATGIGRTKLAEAKAVVAAAEDESLPEPVRQVAKAAVEQMDRTGNVHGAATKVALWVEVLQQDTQIDGLRAENATLRSLLTKLTSPAAAHVEDPATWRCHQPELIDADGQHWLAQRAAGDFT